MTENEKRYQVGLSELMEYLRQDEPGSAEEVLGMMLPVLRQVSGLLEESSGDPGMVELARQVLDGVVEQADRFLEKEASDEDVVLYVRELEGERVGELTHMGFVSGEDGVMLPVELSEPVAVSAELMNVVGLMAFWPEADGVGEVEEKQSSGPEPGLSEWLMMAEEQEKSVEEEDGFEEWLESLGSELVQDVVGVYMRELRDIKLMSAEEEVEFAKRIERGNEAKKFLDEQGQVVDGEELEELEGAIVDGEAAREEMVLRNRRLVVSIAKKYKNRGMDFLDLIQEGNIGLMRAVEKYDYKTGNRFSTYATWWIWQGVKRSLANQGRTIRVPVNVVDQINKVKKVRRAIEQVEERPATNEEIAREMELKPDEVEALVKIEKEPKSLESPVGNEGTVLGDLVEDRGAPVAAEVTEHNMLVERLNEALAKLPEREANILRLRYGLEDGEPWTLEEIGRKFGVTRKRTHQLVHQALSRIRNSSDERVLAVFYDLDWKKKQRKRRGY